MKTFNTCQTCGKPKPNDITEECCQCALTSFERWMNKPVRRVQVYSWKLANELHGQEPIHLFRARKHYRDRVSIQTRFNVATALRWRRKRKSIVLPTYNESTGEYTTP